jgi:uncharacterized protein YqeY
MGLFDKVSSDLKAAMLNRQKERLEPLRAIKTAFLLARSESAAHELSSDEELKIIQKLVKQRKESADIFKAQNRMDLCQKELDEASVIEEYLPRQLTAEELEPLLKSIIQRLGAVTQKDMGKVMGAASKELAGKADNRAIAEKVKELLGS